MYGILIYEKEDAIKNEWFINELIKCADEKNIRLKLVYLEDIIDKPLEDIIFIDDKRISFAINRSRNSEISSRLETLSVTQINCTKIIDIANDKAKTYSFLGESGIPFLEYVRIGIDSFDESDITLLFPVVVKPSHGHGGSGVTLANDMDSLKDIIRHMNDIWPNEDSVVIQKCARDIGRDLRVYIMDGKILAGVMRTSANGELCANFSLGGNCSLHKLSAEEENLCHRILTVLEQKHMHPDFIGIDFVYDDGKPVFNEIEDAVGSRMLYQLTEIDVAKEFIKHVTK